MVGPSFEAAMIREQFSAAVIDTLGIFESGFSPRSGERHFDYDLNETTDAGSWPAIGPYDVIVAAEIIEHLYVPPQSVFPFFASRLATGGKVIVQTPNAVALVKRLRMLAGRHPYMQLRPPRPDPGHVREYTFEELSRAALASNLVIEQAFARNYFGYAGGSGKAYNALCSILSRGLRNGLTFVLGHSEA